MNPIERLCLFLALTALSCTASARDDLIAIDVLLQPGPKMLQEAQNWNARMRQQRPEGFELDQEHVPHITLVQRFIAEADLPTVLSAVEQVRARFDVSQFALKATGLYHIPMDDIGLAGIVVEPSTELRDLQQAVVDAVEPYARAGGGESAFVPDKSGTPISPFLFEYVESFVPRQTGERFNPHVTVGTAPLHWLEEREKEPFPAFTFGAKGIATYQLGNYGTASRRLDTGRGTP